MTSRARRTALLAAAPLAIAGGVLTATPALADPAPVTHDQDYFAEAVTVVDDDYWVLDLSWTPSDGWVVSASGPGGYSQSITQSLLDSQVEVQGQGKKVVLPATRIEQGGRTTTVAGTFHVTGGAIAQEIDRYSPEDCGSAVRQSSVTRGAGATVTMFGHDLDLQPATQDDPYEGGMVTVDRLTGRSC